MYYPPGAYMMGLSDKRRAEPQAQPRGPGLADISTQSERPATRRQAPAQAQPQDQSHLLEVASRLFGKVQYGPTDANGNPVMSASHTGDGMLGYGQIPDNVRQAVGISGNPIGWKWDDLDPEEKALLARMVGPGMYQRQRQAQEDVANDPRYAPK